MPLLSGLTKMIPDCTRQKVQRWARSFNLEKEINERRVAEPRVSTDVVRLQHGGGGQDYFDE